jgi:AAA ATPase domain
MTLLDLPNLFTTINPNNTRIDSRCYINFASVRGGKLIEPLALTITRQEADLPTCQLLTGCRGSGKSMELLKLKFLLEQQGFYVVYFEFEQDSETYVSDVDKILVSSGRKVSENLEAIKIKARRGCLARFIPFLETFKKIKLKSELEREIPWIGKLKIAVEPQDSTKPNSHFRKYWQALPKGNLQSLNEELIEPAISQLKQRNYKGLVIIVDNLDQVEFLPKVQDVSSQNSLEEWDRKLSNYERIFIDQGSELRKLNCHIIYTVPLPLIFSSRYGELKNRLGGGLDPKVLRMVPVTLQNGEDCEDGMELLRQVLLAKAFPHIDFEERFRLKTELIKQLFDDSNTLDLLCKASGGNIRNLLRLFYSCITQEDPPLSYRCVSEEIEKYCNSLLLAITEDEWDSICKIVAQNSLKGIDEKKILLQSMQREFVFWYSYRGENWFGANPAIVQVKK